MTDNSTSKMAYDGMLTAGRIAIKWESYRDSVKRFYMIDKEKGENEYKDRMILLQTIIKKYAEKHGIEQLQAIIDIGNKEEGMLALQFLAAGFELTSGNDFTACS